MYQLIDSKDKIIAPKAIQQWKTELSPYLDINDLVKKMWKQFSMYIRIYNILRNTTSIYGIILVCIFTGKKTSNTGGFNVNNILFGEMPFSGCNKFVNL